MPTLATISHRHRAARCRTSPERTCVGFLVAKQIMAFALLRKKRLGEEEFLKHEQAGQARTPLSRLFLEIGHGACAHRHTVAARLGNLIGGGGNNRGKAANATLTCLITRDDGGEIQRHGTTFCQPTMALSELRSQREGMPGSIFCIIIVSLHIVGFERTRMLSRT